MELSTAQRLSALNQRFYSEHAENFADSRPRLAAGVQRVLAAVPAGARVLEVGCGDGKVGRALARAGVGAYVGLDASEAMLERARAYTTNSDGKKGAGDEPPGTEGGRRRRTENAAASFVFRPPSFVFLSADLAKSNWPSVLPPDPFDWILSFAVFHHLPGYALRAGVLRTLAEHLAPGSRIVLSNWQFTRSARATARIVPWAAAGLSDDDVELGDYLLSWERKGQHGLRYLHLLDKPEAERLAAEAGLRVVETFSADGATGDLSEYVVMEHASV